MFNDYGYFKTITQNIEKVMKEQGENIEKAAKAMADAIEQDKLISVYGGGGHTTLCMGEMFFRAGGLCNINPIMEPALSVFNQSLKYLELERTVNFGSSIVKYYDLKEGDLLIIFHNIGSKEKRREDYCSFQFLLAKRNAKRPLYPSPLW